MDAVCGVIEKRISKQIHSGKRTVSGWASKQILDRDGEIILTAGWELKNFLRHPVLMAFHSYNQLPCGKVFQIKKEPEGLWFAAEIFESPLGDEILKVGEKLGTLAISVGFIPIESEMMTKQQVAAMGIDVSNARDQIRVFQRQELAEISICAVGSNPDALVREKSLKGLVRKSLNTSLSKGMSADLLVDSILAEIDVDKFIQAKRMIKQGKIFEEEDLIKFILRKR